MTSSPLSTSLRVLRCNPSDPDPSIDTVAMGHKLDAPTVGPTDLSRYIQSRDEELLRFVEGVKPCWFHVKRLPMQFLAAVIDSLLNRSEQRIMAFRAAVHLIEDPAGQLALVAPKEKGEYVATKGDYGVLVAPMAWSQEVADRFGAETVQEIGEIALTASRLRRGAKGPFGFWGMSVATS